jgi:hypothetical protein
MNPPSMESIFLILSGVILVAGVLYWLWSHIQLTQKKVQLLENAVFELRGMLANSGGGERSGNPLGASGPGVGAPASPTRQIQLNTTVVGGSGDVEVTRTDEADEDDGWGDEAPTASPSNRVSTPLDALDAPVLEVVDDLQPGGRAAPGVIAEEAAPVATIEEERRSEDFRRLFAVQDVTEVATSVAPTPASSSTSVASAPAAKTPESLESMPVKELRRLAEQRGIAGATDMRKKEILAALRQQVTTTTTVNLTLPEPGAEAGEVKEVSIEREGHESSDAVVTTEILE